MRPKHTTQHHGKEVKLTRVEERKRKRQEKKQRKSEWYGCAQKKNNLQDNGGMQRRKRTTDAIADSAVPYFSEETFSTFTSSDVLTSVGSAEEDAALISYLEQQLGIQNPKDSKQIRKEIREAELGGDDLYDLVDGILTGETVDALLSDNDELLPAQDDEKVNAHQVSDLEDDISSDASTCVNETDNESEKSETASLSSEREHDDQNENRNDLGDEAITSPASRKRELDVTETCEIPKYVSPHLRKRLRENESQTLHSALPRESPGSLDEMVEQVCAVTKPSLKSLFNRVSEGNLNVVLNEMLKTVKKAKETLELSLLGSPDEESIPSASENLLERLCSCLAAVPLDYLGMNSGAPLIAPQIAMVCALSGLVSSQVVLESFSCVWKLYTTTSTKLFSSDKKEHESSCHKVVSPTASTACFEESVDLMLTCRQTITAISLLYFFSLLHPSVLLACARHLLPHGDDVTRVKTRKAELLTLMLRFTGHQLKAESLEHYKQLEKIIAEIERSLEGHSNAQIDFLKHELAHAGKLKRAPAYERYQAMRTWLHSKSGTFRSTNWAAVQVDSTQPERLLADFAQGRWKQHLTSSAAADIWKSQSGGSEGQQRDEFVALARKMHIKSPLQQRVFVAMMEAKDAEDAAFRILKIASKKKQLENVIAVILLCAQREKPYNVFYQDLCECLCTSADIQVSSRARRTVRQALHVIGSSLREENTATSSERKARIKQLADALIEKGLLPKSDSLLDKLT